LIEYLENLGLERALVDVEHGGDAGRPAPGLPKSPGRGHRSLEGLEPERGPAADPSSGRSAGVGVLEHLYSFLAEVSKIAFARHGELRNTRREV
jgi:hypothetical protein